MFRPGKKPSVPSVLFFSAMLCTSVNCSKKPQSPATTRPAQAAAAPAAVADEHPLPPPLSRSYIQTEIRLAGNIRDVFVHGRNLTNFSRPHHIYSAEVSPDNRYVLVWHMDYSPRKVSIYELESFRKVSTFVPGAGGIICWADYHLIYHRWGAGTNTALWEVYSVAGETLWEGFSSGAHLCESGRYVFVYPSLPGTKEEILVADVRNGDIIGRARPEDIAWTETIRWVDGLTVRAWYGTLDDKTRSVDIRVRPDRPEKWKAVDHVDSL